MSVDPVSLAVTVALNAASMAMTASQQFEGPRLEDLKVTTADYGTALNYFYGLRRFDGCPCFWAEDLREIKRQNKTKGGKYNEYTYYGTWAVAVADHEIGAVTRIWFDRKLIYDATGAGPLMPVRITDFYRELGAEIIGTELPIPIRIYLGATTQEVDPRMAATVDAEHGAGSTPAYRGLAYILFEDVPLEKFGNRLPMVTVEAATVGADDFPVETRTNPEVDVHELFGFRFSADGSRFFLGGNDGYEIWETGSRQLMISGTLTSGGGHGHQRLSGVAEDGTIWMIGSGSFLRYYQPDGVGLPTDIGSASEGDYVHGVLRDGNGVEHVCVVRDSTFTDGFKHRIGTADGVELLDTSAQTGYDWQIKAYCVDLYGDVWAFGGGGGLASNQLAVWRIEWTGTRAGPDFAIVTMPNAMVGSITYCEAYHYKDDDVDHFVVGWNRLGSEYLVTIDIDTLAITQTRAFTPMDPDHARVQFANLPAGSASIWLQEYEISSADLTTIRQIDFADWGYAGLGAASCIYDRVNHAIILGTGANTFAWLYLDRVSSDGVTLRSIVEDVSERCGLVVANDIDATDLTQTVEGYSWTQGSGKQILEPLLEAYDSEARPHDFLIQFLRRGVASLGSIPVAQMGAGGGLRYETAANLDTDLPHRVSLTFADLDKDQQANTALAQRPGAAVDSKREVSLDLTTLALGADQGRQMADGWMRRTWFGSASVTTALTRAYSKLEPGDAYVFVLDDAQVKAKITRIEFGANGVLSCEAERYNPAIHTPTSLPGADADGLSEAVVAAIGYTKGIVLDTPIITDSHDDLIVYMAAAPYSTATTWPGAAFWRSADGIDYDVELGSVASTQAAVIGYSTGALASALETVWDRASSVTVKLHDGALTSATEAEVENGANLALIGDELVGFTTATLTAVSTYALSGFLRGRRGTEWAIGTHVAGDRFVLMRTSLPQAEMGASDVGDLLYFKPITNGGLTGFPQSMTYTGASLKPYAVAHLKWVDSSGDKVATWVRRTRIGGAWRDYQDASLGEGSEAYLGQVLNGAGTVIRTFSGLTSPTLTYTAAQQAADGGAGVTLRVYQVSATVGNGFAATVAL